MKGKKRQYKGFIRMNNFIEKIVSLFCQSQKCAHNEGLQIFIMLQ